MLGSLKRTINLTKFRMNLRKTIQQQDMELLQITRQEVIKEIERRQKHK